MSVMENIKLNLDSINLDDYIFETGNQCSDEQLEIFMKRLNVKEKNKFLYGFLLFYSINGATNAKSTLGFTVKYSIKEQYKYSMQELTEAAVYAATTIRQICRKFSDITIELLRKTNTETRIYRKYNELLKLEKEYSFDFANFTKTISELQNTKLYMIKVNKLIRRKIITKYEQCPYLYKKNDEIIRNDDIGKKLFKDTIILFKIDLDNI